MMAGMSETMRIVFGALGFIGGLAGLAGAFIVWRGSRRQRVRPRPLAEDEHVVLLSPGQQITDPDEAEALGLTADARRMRRAR